MSRFAPSPADTPRAARVLARWLWVVAAMVFAIVVIGGITRLTESGLSITEWKPVSGTLPPIGDAAWSEAFEKYRATPEYQQINKGMSMESFQFIFFWEWVHRLWGRLIGAAMVVPLIWYAWRRMIPAGYFPRLLALAALVGLQGALGWWMVASGLEARTDVSHYRLAAHLLTALVILAGLVWTARDLLALAGNPATPRPSRLTGFGIGVIVVLVIQLLFGAYVAGLNAGQVANSWPLMNERLFPDGINWSAGVVSAVFNDPFLLHFIHRWWAWVAAAALIWLAVRVKRAGDRRAAVLIHIAVGTQMILGIATVVSGVAFGIALAHQAVGALVVAAAANGLHRLGRPAA
jgi:cytochrome c oxidase assembly protein subunit 15